MAAADWRCSHREHVPIALPALRGRSRPPWQISLVATFIRTQVIRYRRVEGAGYRNGALTMRHGAPERPSHHFTRSIVPVRARPRRLVRNLARSPWGGGQSYDTASLLQRHPFTSTAGSAAGRHDGRDCPA